MFDDGTNVGVGVAVSATTFLNLAASTTAKGQIRFTAGTRPTSPATTDAYGISGGVEFGGDVNVYPLRDATTSTVRTIAADANGKLIASATARALGLYSSAADVTTTSTSATTLLSGTALGSATYQAAFWAVGRAVKIKARGLITTTGTPGNLTLDVLIGGTSVGTLVIALPASVTGAYIDIELVLINRVNSATVGRFHLAGNAVVEGTLMASNGVATTSATDFNTTTSQAIDLRGTFSAASQSLTITSTVIDFQN
jgi:hypothetical protein